MVYFRSVGICLVCSILHSEFLEGVSAVCCVQGLGQETVSAALESLLLGLAAFVGYMPIGFQQLFDYPSEPVASVSCVFGVVGIQGCCLTRRP